MDVVAAHMSDAGRTGDRTEMLDMDWSHSLQANRQHYTTSLNLEYRRETEKMTTEKHLAPQSEQTSKKLDTRGDS